MLEQKSLPSGAQLLYSLFETSEAPHLGRLWRTPVAKHENIFSFFSARMPTIIIHFIILKIPKPHIFDDSVTDMMLEAPGG